MKKELFDTVIIGAGPSGLAAVESIKKNQKILIIDQGMKSNDRNHKDAGHLGFGIGGAGLFSDGKFSYFPAGTAVYKLNEKDLIKEAHKWVEAKMKIHNIDYSNFESFNFTDNDDLLTLLKEKKYPSFYASSEQRRNLMDDISSINEKAEIWTRSSLVGLSKTESFYELDIECLDKNIIKKVITKNIILASGRFGSKDLKRILKNKTQLPFKYNRVEFGVRVESPSNIGFLCRKKNPDVKYIWKSKFGEVRTFCTCRDGEIWNIPYHNGISALSGRSDGPSSGYSNFGLLIRVNLFSLGNEIIKNIFNNDAIKNGNAIYQSLQSFMGKTPINTDQDIVPENRPWFPINTFKKGNLEALLGKSCSVLLKEALDSLLKESFDLNDDRTMIIFPSIEGVGDYLEVDNNLKVIGENIWVCGDSNGSFRGLIPAFVSGYYAGKISS